MGKLNILHHKDWHVYSKVNKDRVKEDERKEAEKQKIIDDKRIKVEQETRINALRKKSNIVKESVAEHINFFKDIIPFDKIKTDEEIELKRKHDFHTMFLGETKDGHKDSPWYTSLELDVGTRSSTNGFVYKDDEIKGTTIKGKEERRLKREKRRLETEDPMYIVKKASRPETPAKVQKFTRQSKSIDDLRKERLQRESLERDRARKLLGYRDDRHSKEEKFYNSQFNPDLIKPKELQRNKRPLW